MREFHEADGQHEKPCHWFAGKPGDIGYVQWREQWDIWFARENSLNALRNKAQAERISRNHKRATFVLLVGVPIVFVLWLMAATA
jgi:hypothetical protein